MATAQGIPHVVMRPTPVFAYSPLSSQVYDLVAGPPGLENQLTVLGPRVHCSPLGG